jgi:hypothetical protein
LHPALSFANVTHFENLFDPTPDSAIMSEPRFRYAGLGDVKKRGLSVQSAATRLHHLSFVEKRLMFWCAAHLVGTPNRDFKLLLGRAQFLAAERCAGLRKRLQELRMPKVRIDNRPSETLELAMDETIHCESSEEVAAIVHGLRADLLMTYLRYLDETNPLADAPSCDLISSQIPLLRGITESLQAFVQMPADQDPGSRIEKFISAAGGLDGSKPSSDTLPPRERSEKPFEIDRNSGRPAASAMVWDYLKPPLEEVSDHFVHMLGIRLSEINVAEGWRS